MSPFFQAGTIEEDMDAKGELVPIIAICAAANAVMAFLCLQKDKRNNPSFPLVRRGCYLLAWILTVTTFFLSVYFANNSVKYWSNLLDLQLCMGFLLWFCSWGIDRKTPPSAG